MNKPSEIALIGNGAMALELFELFGANFFSAVYTEPEFSASNRVNLPQYTDMAALRTAATHYVLAIGDASDRCRLSADLERQGLQPCPPLILPSASVSPSAHLADGTIVGHGVQIGARCKIGSHNFLMHHVVMGHDSQTGSHVILSPGCYIAGYVDIGNRVTVQANAAIARSLTVGDDAMICQAASCFRAVPANATAIGNPARIQIT